jgi:hypothetical protein
MTFHRTGPCSQGLETKGFDTTLLKFASNYQILCHNELHRVTIFLFALQQKRKIAIRGGGGSYIYLTEKMRYALSVMFLKHEGKREHSTFSSIQEDNIKMEVKGKVRGVH